MRNFLSIEDVIGLLLLALFFILALYVIWRFCTPREEKPPVKAAMRNDGPNVKFDEPKEG